MGKAVFIACFAAAFCGAFFFGVSVRASAPAQATPTAAPAAVPAAPVAAPTPPAAEAPAAVSPSAASAAAPVAPAATGDVLIDKLNAKRFAAAPYMVPTSALVKQNAEKKKGQAYHVQLPGPPYCHTFVATAGDDVKAVSLTLASPAGEKSAADEAEGSAAAIANFCPMVPGTYTLTVSLPKDTGEFAVQVFSK